MNIEGVKSAIEFVKYLMALSGAGIGFVIHSSFYDESLLLKILTSFTACLLSASIISGLVCHSRGAVMLSKNITNLHDKHFMIPGLICHFTFGFGLMFLVFAGGFKIWS